MRNGSSAVTFLALALVVALGACGGGSTTGVDSTPSGTRTNAAPALLVTASGSGAVISDPSGINCGDRCAVALSAGASVTLSAKPSADSRFDGWGGACAGTGNCNVTLARTELVTAAFSSTRAGADYVLALIESGAGTVSSNPSGILCQSSCSASFASATAVTLTAQAGAGYLFAGWGGACSGNATCSFAMNSNQVVTATFTPSVTTDQVLTVTQSGLGAVTIDPGVMLCASASCAVQLATGTLATLTAQPGAGFTFDGWGGACSGSQTSCTVAMYLAQSVSAAFSSTNGPSVSLAVSESGPGTVTSTPAGIACGAACTATYSSGTQVTLSAQPAAGYVFGGWTGACSGTASCTLAMGGPELVTASFATIPSSSVLSVANSATGGVVTSNPGGITCGAACSSSFTTGTVVTLIEQAQAGYVFAGWGGACSGSATSCVVAMNSAQSVTASYAPAGASSYALTLGSAGTGSGTVTSSTAGISCASVCSANLASGTVVSLNAQPAAGSTFSGWSGACSGTGTCSVTMSAAQTVTAAYVLASTGSAAFSISVAGSRLVDASGNAVQLRGVNVSGLEGVAIAGWDPSNPWGSQTGTATPDWATIKTWGANTVRLPLNEASWLGLSCVDVGGLSVHYVNGVKIQDAAGDTIQADPGGNYQATVAATVAGASAAGLYVIVDLHLTAPGNACPNMQNPMADADHAIAFWASVAAAFKSYPNVLFELFNEPFLDQVPLTGATPWAALLNGGGTFTSYLAQTPTNPWYVATSYTWQNAGMQQMLNAVRATGATNVILTSTLAYSSTMSGWLQYHPTDTISPGQVAAVWHAYPAIGYPSQASCIGLPACSAQLLLDVQAILAAGYPVVITEFGDLIGVSPPAWVSQLLPFADANGIGYLGWTWDTWSGMSANVLITDAAGDPTPGYGAYVKAHYLCRAAGTAVCP